MQTYNTSICIMAFEDAKTIEFAEIIRNAKRFILSMQNDESKGYTSDSLHYGGISYGSGEKPADMSNLQWALEAMQVKYIEKDGIIQPFEDKEMKKEQQLFWDKAIQFLQRCQNLKKTNDQPYTVNDGGFMYGPGTSKAGDTKSYGSMTYAGLKSFIYAKISKNDPRVQAAFKWICENYSVAENPGLGMQGLYYNYHTMAKALNAYGEEILVDQQGKKRKWREELADQLLKIQQSDGYWINENGRWWENNPVLVTAYVVLALEEVVG
jgi:squalene-hopene/tetraprenyl-beta-curcumene cyclase